MGSRNIKRLIPGLLLVTLLCWSATLFSQIPPGLNGTLIVINKGDNNASFIDLASGEILSTLPTGAGPHELIVTRDGRWAVSTDYIGGNSLTVFDVANLSVARTIELSGHPAPHGIQLTRNEQQVVVTTEGSNEILVVDFHSGEISRSIDTSQRGSHMVALKEDSSMAYTANGRDNSISVIDLMAGQTVKVLDVPASPEAITANWSGTDIWVGSNREGVVSVINPLDGNIRRQLDGFSWPYRILLTGDERFAIVPDFRNQDLRVFDARTGEQTGALDLPGGGPQGLTLFGDDRTLFLSLSAQDKVVVINIESMELLVEYATGSQPDGIGYSILKLK